MPPEQSSDVKFEIGHVLFIDIVGYSKLLINEQSEQMQTLREIVRGTEQFRAAEAEGKLLRLPTGDGGALVFRTSPEAPVRCALEISKELKKHPELRVRMGIHSGAVNEITDRERETRATRGRIFTSSGKRTLGRSTKRCDAILSSQGPSAICQRRGYLVLLLRSGRTRSGCGRTSARRGGRQSMSGERVARFS